MSNEVQQNPYTSMSARYAVGLLTVVYTFNFIDRQLLSILQESIKADLLLSDQQLGLLTGIAFAMFYVTAGIPIARWADRGNRRNIVALAIGVWSFMTAISGLVQNYVQLLLARMGVGVGEVWWQSASALYYFGHLPARASGQRPGVLLYGCKHRYPVRLLSRWLAERDIRLAYCVFRGGSAGPHHCADRSLHPARAY